MRVKPFVKKKVSNEILFTTNYKKKVSKSRGYYATHHGMKKTTVFQLVALLSFAKVGNRDESWL